MNETSLFIRQLDAVITENAMLNHPFYQTWRMGKLSNEALRGYAKQYYHFVHAFPTYLSATHANTPHLAVRQQLLENLLEEERGENNHPSLWLRFAESLGISGEEARTTDLLPETERAIATLRSVTRDRSYLDGVAALYSYESQIPEVARVKIDGLKTFYGVSAPSALSFFTVHQEADIYHSGDERAILERYAVGPEQQKTCLESARTASQAMLHLLDGVQRAFVGN